VSLFKLYTTSIEVRGGVFLVGGNRGFITLDCFVKIQLARPGVAQAVMSFCMVCLQCNGFI